VAIGICKLTLKTGTFVKSHLIPLCFSGPSEGQYFIDGTPGGRPTRRPTSWYDRALVVRKGEDVLSELDSSAAIELRKGKLVWSGWSGDSDVQEEVAPNSGEKFGLRTVSGLDVLNLRVFFLSILWRAAASNLPQNAHVKLPANELEQLRLMVLHKNPYPLSFLPVQLTQLTSLGPRHNLGPLKMKLPFKLEVEKEELFLQSYRFYFDGLVANIFFDMSFELHESMSAIYLGGDDSVLAVCVPYDESFQASNIQQHQYEAVTNYPDTMIKLLR